MVGDGREESDSDESARARASRTQPVNQRPAATLHPHTNLMPVSGNYMAQVSSSLSESSDRSNSEESKRSFKQSSMRFQQMVQQQSPRKRQKTEQRFTNYTMPVAASSREAGQPVHLPASRSQSIEPVAAMRTPFRLSPNSRPTAVPRTTALRSSPPSSATSLPRLAAYLQKPADAAAKPAPKQQASGVDQVGAATPLQVVSDAGGSSVSGGSEPGFGAQERGPQEQGAHEERGPQERGPRERSPHEELGPREETDSRVGVAAPEPDAHETIHEANVHDAGSDYNADTSVHSNNLLQRMMAFSKHMLEGSRELGTQLSPTDPYPRPFAVGQPDRPHAFDAYRGEPLGSSRASSVHNFPTNTNERHDNYEYSMPPEERTARIRTARLPPSRPQSQVWARPVLNTSSSQHTPLYSSAEPFAQTHPLHPHNANESITKLTARLMAERLAPSPHITDVSGGAVNRQGPVFTRRHSTSSESMSVPVSMQSPNPHLTPHTPSKNDYMAKIDAIPGAIVPAHNRHYLKWDGAQWRNFIQAMRQAIDATGTTSDEVVRFLALLSEQMPGNMQQMSVDELVQRISACKTRRPR